MRTKMSLHTTLTELYEGETPRAHRFRYALLVADIITLAFILAASFFHGHLIIESLNLVFGVYIALDLSARLFIAKSKTAFLANPWNVLDGIVLISFLLPLTGEYLAFMRAARMLRLLRSYQLLKRLREDFAFFRKHEDVVLSATNLMVFIFVMTEIVFQSQVGRNPHINNFIDAMYFTVTTLTTTGFGDITLTGSFGRGLAIIIMIFGVSLFIRLVQTAFRPNKVRFPCPDCGLFLHDRDAVHCKHCGLKLAIPDEGIN